jgi:hypothetical protein
VMSQHPTQRLSVVIQSKAPWCCDLRCFRLPGKAATPACHPGWSISSNFGRPVRRGSGLGAS